MKLVLFDIDGTLIEHTGTLHPRYRFLSALKDVFGKDIPFDPSIDLLGCIDRQIAWRLLEPYGVTREEYEKRFNEFTQALLHRTRHYAKKGTIGYIPIPEAVQLATLLKQQKDTRIGLLTGNTPAIAWWKLDTIGIRDLFSFGVFGDDVEDRIALAQKVFLLAKKYYHHDFSPTDVVVIGDTAFDVRCGKAIGAHTIAVTTGGHLVTKVNPKAGSYEEALRMEQPDILVESLMDKPVLDFFGINGVQQEKS